MYKCMRCGFLTFFERPKSVNFTWPNRSKRIFSGFKSLKEIYGYVQENKYVCMYVCMNSRIPRCVQGLYIYRVGWPVDDHVAVQVCQGHTNLRWVEPHHALPYIHVAHTTIPYHTYHTQITITSVNLRSFFRWKNTSPPEQYSVTYIHT